MSFTQQASQKQQFSLKSIFWNVALCGFPLILVSPPFFERWRQHAQQLDPNEQTAILFFYGMMLSFIPGLLICYVCDKLKHKDIRLEGNTLSSRPPYSHRFFIQYTIAAILTPLLFVLLPIDFVRSPITSLKFFAVVLAAITSVDIVCSLRIWRAERVHRHLRAERRASALANLGKENQWTDAELRKSDAVDVKYLFRNADLQAGIQAVRRFDNPPTIRYAIVTLLWGVALLVAIRAVDTKLAWIVLPFLLGCPLVVLKKYRQRRAQEVRAEGVTIRVSRESLVTSALGKTYVHPWKSMSGYATTRDYFFVFFFAADVVPKGKHVAFILPRRVLTPHEQLEVESILLERIGAGNTTVHQNLHRRLVRECIYLFVIAAISLLVLIP